MKQITQIKREKEGEGGRERSGYEIKGPYGAEQN